MTQAIFGRAMYLGFVSLENPKLFLAEPANVETHEYLVLSQVLRLLELGTFWPQMHLVCFKRIH
jgi:hypothetical protein